MLLKTSGSIFNTQLQMLVQVSKGVASGSVCPVCWVLVTSYHAYLPQDITSIRKILIPVNLGYHWILLVGYNSLMLNILYFHKKCCLYVQVYEIERKSSILTWLLYGWPDFFKCPYTNVMAMIGYVCIVWVAFWWFGLCFILVGKF